jgi:hypothetical protein
MFFCREFEPVSSVITREATGLRRGVLNATRTTIGAKKNLLRGISLFSN